MKDFLYFCANICATVMGFLALFIVFIVFPFSTFVNYISETSCEQIASANNIKYQYHFASGCLLNINGKMIPLDNYKNIDMNKDK